MPQPPSLASVLAKQYGLNAVRIEPIPQGFGTSNWLATSAGGRFFLKVYPDDTDLAAEEEALRLGEYARRRGVPVPVVRQTLSGELLAAGSQPACALFDYVADADSGGALSVERMAQAGEVLGRIHRLFRHYPACGAGLTQKWLSFDEDQKAQELDSYLRRIDAKDQRDAFDVRTQPLLQRRKELLPEAARILKRLPSLTSQVIHDDYSPPNLLFHGTKLAAVVDFRPPCPFLVAYELGRVALSPNNLGTEDWRTRAVALVEAYCAVDDGSPDDVRFAPHVWLVQLLRSMYGVKQHYTRPLPLQPDLDDFWFQRAHAAEIIFQNLEELEETFCMAQS